MENGEDVALRNGQLMIDGTTPNGGTGVKASLDEDDVLTASFSDANYGPVPVHAVVDQFNKISRVFGMSCMLVDDRVTIKLPLVTLDNCDNSWETLRSILDVAKLIHDRAYDMALEKAVF